MTYLGETKSCIAVFDPESRIFSLKQKVQHYSDALRKSIVQQYLWGAEFSLLIAKKCSDHGDLYSTAGCATRIVSYFTQVLFALNAEYFISDREAVSAIDTFEARPKEYASRLSTLFEEMGQGHSGMQKSVEILMQMFDEIKTLAFGLYESKYLTN